MTQISMKTLLGFFLFLIILPNFSSTQASQDLSEFIYSRIVLVDTEFEYIFHEEIEPFDRLVTEIIFCVNVEFWNRADKPLTITSSNSIGYYLRMINLTNNIDKNIDSREVRRSDIEFRSGITSKSLVAQLFINDFYRIRPGNYEIYLGDGEVKSSNSYSAHLEISINETKVSYDQTPDDWGQTFEYTDINQYIRILLLVMVIVFILVSWRSRYEIPQYRV